MQIARLSDFLSVDVEFGEGRIEITFQYFTKPLS